MQVSLPNLIAVGQISKSVGVRGEVRVRPLTEDPERFKNLSLVWIGEGEDAAREISVEYARVRGSSVVLKFEGVGTRRFSDDLRGKFVFVLSDQAIRPPHGSYFIHEIIGVSVATEAGERVGEVCDVQRFPGHDVWVVEKGTKKILIPATKEIIREVDMEKRMIVIRPLEGLLE